MKNIKLAAICLAALAMTGCKKKAEFTYNTATVEKTNITTSVTATGTIEPVTKVEVGTQVSGIVSKLYVDYNSVVKAGQVIAELDRTNLMAELSSAEANLRSAQSDLAYQKANYERFKNLYDKGLISANDYDQAKLSYVKTQQTVTQQTQNVKRARTNLGYATITSPIDGIVLSKEVEEGQTVASSFNTPTLFTIAQDLTNMRVIANVDEADIGDVREGQRVTFTVDAFPNDMFEGSVTQVRQQPTTESNVVTYEVVIGAPNEDLKLKPGLTANVTIHTLDTGEVLAVSTKALHFTPNEMMLAEGETIQDVESPAKLWVREGKVFRAIAVETGTTNGMLTQITKGAQAGTEVLTDVQMVMPEMKQQETQNPFMPKWKDRKDKQGKGGPKK